MKTTRAKFAAAFIALFSAVFLFGGGYVLYWQRSGEPTTATVTRCQKIRRAPVCNGTWMTGGKFHMGIIENAIPEDIGQRIEVRAMGERAIKPGLRLPIILFSIGIAVAILGVIWWIREA